MQKRAVKTAAVCLGGLLLMLGLVSCSTLNDADATGDEREKAAKEQTIGDESEMAAEEKTIGDESEMTAEERSVGDESEMATEAQSVGGEQKDAWEKNDIHTIRITDGATGEECIFTWEEEPEDFVEIIEKFDALDVEKSENQTAIVGYVYWLRLEDETGTKLHSIVPRGQEIQIDGVNYADYSKGTAMELFLAVDAAWARHIAEDAHGQSGTEGAQATSKEAGIQKKPADLQEPDTLEGVTMEVTYATSRGANLVFTNDTDLEIDYGEDYSLQAYRDGMWYDVEYIIDNAAFEAVAYNVPQGGSGSWGVRWTFFHGELPQGVYRIVKGVMDFRGPGDYTTYQMAAEFAVK